jgi:alpha-tubulin suppressor-like RCC1 family protein
VVVSGLPENIILVSADDNHTCALTVRGVVTCWGWNEDGQLGDGRNYYGSDAAPVGWSLAPVDVLGLGNDGITVSTGLNYSCAMTAGFDVKCWGDNTYGQLGDGTKVDRNVPVIVVGL